MKLKSKFILILLPLSFIFLLAFSGKGYAEQSTLILKILPENELFNIENFAPGKKEIRSITVQNNGDLDLNYAASLKLKTGSQKLYDELDLTIFEGKNLLYTGKLKDFTDFEQHKIAKHNQEQLTFSIGLPSNSGNEFQGLQCVLEFQVNANQSPDEGGNRMFGSTLPSTGTNFYNYLAAGLILIFSGIALQFYLFHRKRLEKIN